MDGLNSMKIHQNPCTQTCQYSPDLAPCDF